MLENLNLTDFLEEISPQRTYYGQFYEMKLKTSIFKQHHKTNQSFVAFKLAVSTKNQVFHLAQTQ